MLTPHSYAAAIHPESIAAEFPPPPFHIERFSSISVDELESVRYRRAKCTIERAYALEFYRRLWRRVDFEPGDFNNLSQLDEIPFYTIDDIRESLEESPPFGLHQAPFGGGWGHTPHRIQFSGGTTGEPRPVLYTGQDREVHEILHARQLWSQGVRPGDTAVVSFAYGPHNAATGLHEAMYRWLGVLVLPLSTGNVTSSEKQLAIASRYKATTLLATSDYLLRLASLASNLGYDLAKDFNFRTFPTAGNTEAVEQAWGRPAYNHYGTYDLAAAAFECEGKNGLHLQEDAYVTQIGDVEDGMSVAEGTHGNLIVTSLYHQAYPIVRFNTLDLTRILPHRTCSCGLKFRRISGFEGRSDNMVKLRGINVWPEALGRIVAEHPASNGEYFCIASRSGHYDELAILIEAATPESAETKTALEQLLHQRLGVHIAVHLRPHGSLAELTGIETHSKPRRFEDKRK